MHAQWNVFYWIQVLWQVIKSYVLYDGASPYKHWALPASDDYQPSSSRWWGILANVHLGTCAPASPFCTVCAAGLAASGGPSQYKSKAKKLQYCIVISAYQWAMMTTVFAKWRDARKRKRPSKPAPNRSVQEIQNTQIMTREIIPKC